MTLGRVRAFQMRNPQARLCVPLLVVILLTTTAPSSDAAKSKVKFKSYDLNSKPSEILTFDFDGDNLDDIILIDKANLLVFFQDRRKGFRESVQLVCSLGDKPSVIWPATFPGRAGQSILVLTHDGVSSLTYVDRSTTPESNMIINRETLIPSETLEAAMIFLTLSAKTAEGFPLIMVPTQKGLEIWEHGDDGVWRFVSSLEHAIARTLSGPHHECAYSTRDYLNIAIKDVNADGRDDLVVCERDYISGTISFQIHRQAPGGRFSKEPSRSFEMPFDEYSWIGLQDINSDGIVDLIKTTWLREPWFIPGSYSGKVLVRVFLSEQDGEMPGRPLQVFRKSDWIPAVPIMDVDGDGYADLVLGYSPLNLREDALRAVAAKTLAYNLRFHFYNEGNYSGKPDCQKTLKIHVNQRGLYAAVSRARFLSNSVNLKGDFNGDGRPDILVRDHKKRLSVYFFRSRERGFSKKADVRFKIGSASRLMLMPKDLNHDGISDLIAIEPEKKLIKVFLSRRTGR